MSQSFAEGTLINERYKVISLLGVGGMGEVYQVEDSELYQQNLALKVILKNLSEDHSIFNRFRSEVLIARGLVHPNIVQVFDLVKAKEGFYYIIMEYVEGETLKDLLSLNIETNNSSPVYFPKPKIYFPEILDILQQLLDGIAYAHKQGVIHRDLKPANIILTKDKKVKLLDFGTARLLENKANLTMTGQVVGTPSYMSPEQIRADELDGRSDLYTIGLIAYELVCAEKPFPADSPLVALHKQLNEPLPIANLEKYLIPEWFKNAIEKATAKDKYHRFQSAEEFLKALKEPNKNEAAILAAKKKDLKYKKFPKLLLLIFVIMLSLIIYFLFFFEGKTEQDNPIIDQLKKENAILEKIAPITTTSSTLNTSTTTSSTLEPTTTTSSTSVSTSSTSTSSTTSSTTLLIKEVSNVTASILFRDPLGNVIDEDTMPLLLLNSLRMIIDVSGLKKDEQVLAENSDFTFIIRNKSSNESKSFPLKIISQGNAFGQSLRLVSDLGQQKRNFKLGPQATGEFEFIATYQQKVIGKRLVNITDTPKGNRNFRDFQKQPPQQQKQMPAHRRSPH